MRIAALAIDNFRSFDTFELPVNRASVYLIGENGSGKSTLLEATARALGIGTRFSKTDFRSIDKPLTLKATLVDLSDTQRPHFMDEIDFSSSSLRVGVRAVWDASQEEIEVVHGFPDHGWRRSKPNQRDSLTVEWFSQSRDTKRTLQFGRHTNLLGRLVKDLSVEESLVATISAIAHARDVLATNEDLQELLVNAQTELSKMIPNVSEKAFVLQSLESTRDEILTHLEIALAHLGLPIPVSLQSTGLGQLSVFAFALHLVRQEPGTIILLDEPEVALHPQAQRALIRSMVETNCQCLIATHSSSLLDRADPRQIVRLHRDAFGDVKCATPTKLSEKDAQRLARFSTPEVAEAFFAQGVILVEGESDKLAVEATADKLNINIDGQGIAIVSLDGAGSLHTFLDLLGPRGLGLRLAGLCDQDKEADWVKRLSAAEIGEIADRADMEAHGFFISEPDLEAELLRAAGDRAQKVVEEKGDQRAFELFANQPSNKGKTSLDLLHDFLATGSRKVIYASSLVDCLDVAELPATLKGVLQSVT